MEMKLGEGTNLEKEYIVNIKGQEILSKKEMSRVLDKLRIGLEINGKQLKRADIAWINSSQLRFTLREGKKHQIR